MALSKSEVKRVSAMGGKMPNRYRSLIMLMVATVLVFAFIYQGTVWCENHKISDPSFYDAQGWCYFCVAVFVVAVLLISDATVGESRKK